MPVVRKSDFENAQAEQAKAVTWSGHALGCPTASGEPVGRCTCKTVSEVPPAPPTHSEPLQRPTQGLSGDAAAKAKVLAASGVKQVFGAVVWSVESGDSVYIVVWTPVPKVMTCTCIAGKHSRPCSHREAVRIFHQSQTGTDLGSSI